MVAAFLAALVLAAAPAPTLAVVDKTPFTVRGAHFHAAEHVRLVVHAKGVHVRTVDATALGRFVVRFAGLSLGRCAAYTVSATGSDGSHALLRVMPECPQKQP